MKDLKGISNFLQTVGQRFSRGPGKPGALSRDQQIKLAGLIIACLVLAAVLVANAKRAQNLRRQQTESEEAKLEAAVSPAPSRRGRRVFKEKEIPPQIQTLLRAVGRKDPFKPVGRRNYTRGTGPSSLTLVGIIWDEDNPQAIFDDSIVAIGDSIAGRKILEIEKEGVVIQDNGSQSRLRLGESLRKKIDLPSGRQP